jgi:hypothetical protein
MKTEFSLKIGDLEVRSNAKDSAEIVQWTTVDKDDPFCWTIAYWNKSSDGYYLQFVGGRPFEANVDPAIFMQLAQRGQKLLETFFNEEE